MTPDGERPRLPEEEEPCIVPGCGAPSARRLSLTEAKKAFSDLPDRGRRAPLCRKHYREWKKATKKSRELERATW
jgi:hypothetical protein